MAEFEGVVKYPDELSADAPIDQAPVDAPFPSLVSPTMTQTLGRAAVYGIPGMGLGLIDTLGQSVGVFDDDSVSGTLKAISPGGFGDYYARNKEPLRMGGEIAGIFIPGMIGLKVLRGSRTALELGKFGELLRNSTSAKALLGNSAELAAREKAVFEAARVAAKDFGTYNGRTFANPAMTAAKRSYYSGRLTETTRQTVVMEMAYKGLYGASELFYPAEATLTDELKWAGLGGALAAGLDFAASKYAVRNLTKAAERLGETAHEFQEFGKKAPEVLSRPGERGPAMAFYSRHWELSTNAIESSANATLKTNARQDITVDENYMKGIAQAMAFDTHPIWPRTQLADDPKKPLESQLQLTLRASQKNPNTFLFATSIRQMPESRLGAFDEMRDELRKAKGAYDDLQSEFDHIPEGKRQAKLATLDKAKARYEELVKAQDEVQVVIENTGDFSVYSMRADNWTDHNSFADIKRSTFTNPEIVDGKKAAVTHSKLEIGGVKLDDRFVLEGIGEKSKPQEWSKVYAMGSKFIRDWKPVKNQIFVANEKAPRFELEGISALAKQNKEAATLVRFDGEFKDMRDVDFHVVDLKYQEFSRLMEQTERLPPNASAKLRALKTDPATVRASLNLPDDIGLATHPLIEVFAQARAQGAKTLSEIFTKKGLTPQADHPIDLLQAAMRDAAGVSDATIQFDIAGKLLQQTDVRPLFVTSKSIPSLSHNDAMIHAMIENKQSIILARLGDINPANAPIVATTVQSFGKTAAITVAKDVMSLHEGNTAGRGVLTGQDRVADQIETIKAMTLLAQDSDRQILKMVGALFKEKLSDQVTTVLARNNTHHKVDINRAEQSYRHGWDVDHLEPQADGTFRYVLEQDSGINKRLFQQYFRTEFPDEGVVYMPNMDISTLNKAGYVPLQVTKEAGEFTQSISDLSLHSGIENNALRVAVGKSPIKLRKFHLPSPEFSREGAWFVRNPVDQVVAKYDTGSPEQNKQRAMEAAQKFTDLYDEPHLAQSLENVKSAHMFDGTWIGVTDFSDQLAKTGVGISGGSARAEVDTSDTTIKNMIRSLTQQFVNVGIRSRAAVFEPQINYAKTVSAQMGITQMGEANIFDRYLAIMFGKSTQAPTGALAKHYIGAENSMDKMLSYLYAVKAEGSALTPASADAARNLRQLVMRGTPDEEWKQYKDKVGQWSPFETAQEWMESTHKETRKIQSKELSAGLAKTSATLALRFLDAGTAWLNTVGFMTTFPAVVKALRPESYGSRAEWEAAAGAWGSQLTTGDLTTFSVSKAASNTIHAFWSGELREPLMDAAKKGAFDLEYALLNNALTEPQLGKKGAFARFVEAASYLADKSEILTKQLSYGMGYKIAKDLMKFDDKNNMHIFALNFMQNNIGNYNPRNKPGMFQGALGLPLGAFQTFMFNYYRQGFGYVERKDLRAATAAYAAQASVFGAQSVPGWSLFNSILFNNEDGSDSITTRLERQLPPGVSDLMMNGALSNIPALFGRSDWNMAVNKRGSVDMTQIPANPLDFSRAAPVRFMWDTLQGIKKTADNVMSGGRFSIQQQEEIFAHFTTNRAIRSIMEMAANAKTDRVGQVVEIGTRDALHVAALMLGTVPSSAQKLQDAYNAQQSVERNQAALRSKLNDNFRARARGGELDMDGLQDDVMSYIRSGGNPAYFGQWLRNNIETSFMQKTDKKLTELASGTRWLEFLNMLAALQQNQPAPSSTQNNRGE